MHFRNTNEICSNIIGETILKEICAARYFSIMVDEATDAANDGQMSVSLQYVHPNTRKIEERFVAFSECVTGVSGKAIADPILWGVKWRGSDDAASFCTPAKVLTVISFLIFKYFFF